MKSKIILNLILVLVLTGLALYAYFRPKETVDPGIGISEIKRDQVARIKIEHRAGTTIELEKRAGGWYLTAPIKTRADALQIDNLSDIVSARTKQKLEATDLRQFDLDPPALRLTLNDQAFSFGRINDITNEQYLATGGAVYLVAPFYGYGLPNDPLKLVSRKPLADAEVPVAFDFGRYRIARDDKGSWSTSGAFRAKQDKPLSQDDFNRWADEWRINSALSAEPHKGSSAAERLTVHFKNGSAVTMQILQKQPQFLLLRTDENMLYRFGEEVGRRLLDPHVVAEK